MVVVLRNDLDSNAIDLQVLQIVCVKNDLKACPTVTSRRLTATLVPFSWDSISESNTIRSGTLCARIRMGDSRLTSALCRRCPELRQRRTRKAWLLGRARPLSA
jgi:hypothetical protein